MNELETFTTREPIPEEALIRAVDTSPLFRGAGIGLHDGQQCRTIRRSQHVTGLETYLYLEPVATLAPDDEPESPSLSADRGWELATEVGLTALSCGAAFAAGMANVGIALSMPMTFGASAFLFGVAATGAVASAAQCGLGVGRVINATFLRSSESNRILDSEEWYVTTTNYLDLLSLVGGGTALGLTAKNAMTFKRATGRPLKAVLRGDLNREEISDSTTSPRCSDAGPAGLEPIGTTGAHAQASAAAAMAVRECKRPQELAERMLDNRLLRRTIRQSAGRCQ